MTTDSWKMTTSQLTTFQTFLSPVEVIKRFNISSFQFHCLAGNILCLLQMMPPEEVSKHLPPPSSFAAPLLAHFPAGCALNGFFGALVVYLLYKLQLKVERNTKM